MVLGSDELERIADDMYRDRRIGGSVYCGNCGYNLRTLPYVYRCPECGNEYNARPLTMRGIFRPDEAGFPFRDIALSVVCILSAVLLFYGAYTSSDMGRLAMGVFFVLMAVWFGVDAGARVARFIKAVGIARRIADEERE